MGMHHAMVLLLDPVTQRLYTVASTGYATSGVGAEIDMGEGVIGVAARERTPVRIGHMTSAYLYSRAVRSSLCADSPGLTLETDIPYPGLAEPHSQLAVPVLSGGRLLGVLFAESPQDLRFGFEDEDVLVALAGQLGAALAWVQNTSESVDTESPGVVSGQVSGAAIQVRRFRANDSIFINDVYLIKGVAGAIFWKLVSDFVRDGRTVFSNRELRLDTALGLPDVTDNLEARLLLLQRRLAEHCPQIQTQKTGRGRFRLIVQCPLVLVEVA